MKGLNPKYVKLLNKTFEKYKNVDVLRIQRNDDDDDDIKDGHFVNSVEKIIVETERKESPKKVKSRKFIKRKVC